MTTNDVLVRHNFVSKLPFKNGLSKDLKVKIMSMRIEYAKVRKAFDEDVQTFVQDATPDEFRILQAKEKRTKAEEARLNELSESLTSEYNSYIATKSAEESNVKKVMFTQEEYEELISIHDEDVVINGQTVPAADFLEIIYNLFVSE